MISYRAHPAGCAQPAGWAPALAPPVARCAILGGVASTALLMVRMCVAVALLGVTLAFADRQIQKLPQRSVLSASALGAVNAAGVVIFFLSLNDPKASLRARILALSLPTLRGERMTQRHLGRLALMTVFVADPGKRSAGRVLLHLPRR